MSGTPTKAAVRDWSAVATFALRYTPEDFFARSKSVEQLLHDAKRGFELAALKFSRFDLTTPSANEDVAELIGNAVRAFEEALEFFMAVRQRPGADDFALPLYLSILGNKMEGTIAQLMKASPTAPRVFEQRKASAMRRAARWSGNRTRGLVMAAPRNRIVIRLLDEIEGKKNSWTHYVLAAGGASKKERKLFKATLHDRVREIIDLPPLSPQSAVKYHGVGVKMLRDAAGVRGDFTTHPAFASGGEFEDFDRARYSKNYLGALSEAWQSVARHLQRADCRNPSRKR